MKTGLRLVLRMAHPAGGSQAEPTSQVAGSDSPFPGFREMGIPFTLQLILENGMGLTCSKNSRVWHPCSFGGDGNEGNSWFLTQTCHRCCQRWIKVTGKRILLLLAGCVDGTGSAVSGSMGFGQKQPKKPPEVHHLSFVPHFIQRVRSSRNAGHSHSWF